MTINLHAAPFPVRPTLRALLPSFCWQSAREIVLMMEAIDENIDTNTIKVTLCVLARSGDIQRERRKAYVKGGVEAFYRNREAA